MISEVRLANFKSFAADAASIPLAPVTILFARRGQARHYHAATR